MPEKGVFDVPQNINHTRMRWVETLLKRDLSQLGCKQQGVNLVWELEPGVELERGKPIIRWPHHIEMYSP